MKVLCVFGRYAYGDPARGDGYEYSNFLPALAALGHEIELFDSFDRTSYVDFADLNQRLINRIIAFKPDLMFCVLMNYEVWFETLDLIHEKSPAVVVNWGTDDSWKFSQYSRYLARHIDLHVTTDGAAAAEAKHLGLNNVIVLQWAASSRRLAEPVGASQCEYDVSFVGAAYGNRRKWIAALQDRGITVACFGQGWAGGPITSEDVVRIFRTSRISLNFADSELRVSGAGINRSRQIKARTFEVPGAGGFLLTEDAPGLGGYFELGSEIVTFMDADDLAQKVRHYLAHPDERDRIAMAGHARVRRDHLYEDRFKEILLKACGNASARMAKDWKLEPQLLAPFVDFHRRGTILRKAAWALGTIGQSLFGSKRARRALRKVTYELSWRLCGERTYRATGLPGRLFYHES